MSRLAADQDIEQVVKALLAMADALRDLGTGGAYSPDGAIRAVAATLGKHLPILAASIDCDEIANSLESIASAIEKHSLSIDRLADMLGKRQEEAA